MAQAINQKTALCRADSEPHQILNATNGEPVACELIRNTLLGEREYAAAAVGKVCRLVTGERIRQVFLLPTGGGREGATPDSIASAILQKRGHTVAREGPQSEGGRDPRQEPSPYFDLNKDRFAAAISFNFSGPTSG